MNKYLAFLMSLYVTLFLNSNAYAELTEQNLENIADSEESFNRRIYSYDFDVSSNGIIHAVYSKPILGTDNAQIIYMSKKVGANFPAENNRQVLESNGYVPSISTFIINDDDNNIVHICYIVQRDFIDHDGITHTQGLVYQTISNGVVSDKINISSGGFHSRMQLNEKGKVIFIRAYEDFLDADGNIRSQPFPKALRIQYLKEDGKTWTDREHILDLPILDDYRIGNFVYDKTRQRYHITFGDKDSVFLRNTYPTVNPPIAGKNPVPFPDGGGHRLWHAYSDDLQQWNASLIDGTGNMSENEFWTGFTIDSKGTPYSANFRYKTDAQGVHQGSTNNIGSFDYLSGQWTTQTVAGKTIGASDSRAGMGADIVIDSNGGFHSVWDNSPDKPIDSLAPIESGVIAGGTTMYHYSPDGVDWQSRQVVLPYSTEGNCRIKIYKNRLLLMVLGDARDAKLVFSEYILPSHNAGVFEISSDKMFYGKGEAIRLHARLQGDNIRAGDLYVVATGPYDVNINTGEFKTLATTKLHYLGNDWQWHNFTDLNKVQALVSNLPLFALSRFLDDLVPLNSHVSAPFNLPARYRIYSLTTKTGSGILEGDILSPLYTYDMHVCSQSNCAEL